MCCFLTVKKKWWPLFLTLLFVFVSWSSLSYSGAVSTQRLSASAAPKSIFTSSASLMTKGLMSCVLLGTASTRAVFTSTFMLTLGTYILFRKMGVNAFALPPTALSSLSSQPLLHFDSPAPPSELITGQCQYLCTQECPATLMVSTKQEPLCIIPVEEKGVLSSHMGDVPSCSELFDHEMSAFRIQNNDRTTIHFSVYPVKDFAHQKHNLSCAIGEARTSQWVPVRMFDSMKKEREEHRKRQIDDTCTTDANNRVYLGQNNLTRCLEQNNGAAFFFVENIDFSQLPLEEQNRFPLYSWQHPFSGNLTMPPFSLNNFNLMRKSNLYAAFFIAIANSTVHANFNNVNLQSRSPTGTLAFELHGHNTIILEIDSANITGKFFSGGVAAVTDRNSSGSIILRIKNKATIKNNSPLAIGATGMAIGYVRRYSNYNITILGNEISIICDRILACGGVIGRIEQGNSNSNSNYSIKADINVIKISSDLAIPENIGIIVGSIKNNNHIKIDSNINHIIISDGRYAGSLGQLISSPQSHTLIIRNTQVNIQATEANALGVARASSGQKSPTILLLSGNGTLATPNHLLFPGGSCAESLIDLSGISFNTMNVGCANASLVESIAASGWRTANSRLAAELCADDPHACHYVNELPLAFVQGEGNTFFLVSQQTHPYNSTITGQGPIRVTQWNWDNVNSVPRINSEFAINGTQIYPANGQILPNSSPISVAMDHDTLLVLFQETSTQLISMPLTTQHDTHYQIHNLELEAPPVQLEGKNLWVQNNNQLLRSSVFPNVESPSFSITLETNDPVVGVAQAGNYTYVAYTSSSDNTNTVRILRFLANGTQDNRWEATLPEHDLYRYRQLKVGGTEKNPVLNLPSVTEAIHSERIDGDTVTVLLPPKGGYGHWLYGKTHMSESFIQDPTSPTEGTTTEATPTEATTTEATTTEATTTEATTTEGTTTEGTTTESSTTEATTTEGTTTEGTTTEGTTTEGTTTEGTTTEGTTTEGTTTEGTTTEGTTTEGTTTEATPTETTTTEAITTEGTTTEATPTETTTTEAITTEGATTEGTTTEGTTTETTTTEAITTEGTTTEGTPTETTTTEGATTEGTTTEAITTEGTTTEGTTTEGTTTESSTTEATTTEGTTTEATTTEGTPTETTTTEAITTEGTPTETTTTEGATTEGTTTEAITTEGTTTEGTTTEGTTTESSTTEATTTEGTTTEATTTEGTTTEGTTTEGTTTEATPTETTTTEAITTEGTTTEATPTEATTTEATTTEDTTTETTTTETTTTSTDGDSSGSGESGNGDTGTEGSTTEGSTTEATTTENTTTEGTTTEDTTTENTTTAATTTEGTTTEGTTTEGTTTETTTTSTDGDSSGSSSGSGESDSGDTRIKGSNNAAVAASFLIPMALIATVGGVGTCAVLHKKKAGYMLNLKARVASQFNKLKCSTHHSKHSGTNTPTNEETQM